MSAEVRLAKPNPAIYRLAMDKAKCEPTHAVMIGDRLDNDIRPAKSLGWHTIRVLQGPSRLQKPRCDAEQPDFTVDNLLDILGLL